MPHEICLFHSSAFLPFRLRAMININVQTDSDTSCFFIFLHNRTCPRSFFNDTNNLFCVTQSTWSLYSGVQYNIFPTLIQRWQILQQTRHYISQRKPASRSSSTKPSARQRIHLRYMYLTPHANDLRHQPPLELQPFRIPRKPCSPYFSSNG